MSNIRTLKLNLLADTDNFSKGLKKASGQSESFSSSMKNTMKGLAKSAALAGVAVAGMAVAFGVDAVKAAIADQKSQKQLQTALKNTTKATDGQVAAAERWITKQQFAYGIADDKLRPALAKLTGVTGDVTKAQDLLSLGMDISAGSGKDLEAVTGILTRAQQGNLAGLKKLGVPLSDATLKNKDLATALQQTAAQFKGAAAANAGTFAGKLEIFNQRIGEAKETIGSAILEAIQPFVEKWLPKISKLVTEVSDGFAGKNGKGGGVALGQSIRNVATAIGAFFTAINTSDTGKQKTLNENLQTMANMFNNIAVGIEKITTAFGFLSRWANSPVGKALINSLPAIGAAVQLQNYLGTDHSTHAPVVRSVGGIPYTWDRKNKKWYTTDLSGKHDYSIQPDLTAPSNFRNSRGGNMGAHTVINLNGIVDAESARRSIESIMQTSSLRTGAVNLNRVAI